MGVKFNRTKRKTKNSLCYESSVARFFYRIVILLSLFSSIQLFAQKKDTSVKDLDELRALEQKYYLEYCSPSNLLQGVKDFDKKELDRIKKMATVKKDSESSIRAKALLAVILRNSGKTDKALEILSDFSGFDKISSNSVYVYKASYLLCFLELAHCYALVKTEKDGQEKESSALRESFKMFDYAVRNSSGYEHAYSLFKYADLLFSLCEFRKSSNYLNEAKQALLAFEKSEQARLSAGDEIKANPDIAILKKRIDDLLFRVSMELLADEYGEAYALYVKARKFYDEKAYEAAGFVCREVFTKYPDTIYDQILRLTYADYLIAGGDIKGAKQWLVEMQKKYPQSPYIGVALMKLGKIYLEYDWDAANSSKYYKDALEWFRAEREKKDLLDLYTVPEKVAVVSSPKDPFSTLDQWHRTVYRREDPMEIVNSRTAPWYVSEMEKECLFMIGFFLFIDGRFDEAKKCFQEVKIINRDIAMLDAKKMPNAVMRLNAACNIGRMVFPVEEKKHLRGKNKLLCAYAELNYLLEKTDVAASLYEQMLNSPSSSDPEKAIAMIGLATVCGLDGKYEKMKTLLEDVLKDFRKYKEIYGHALFRMGMLGMGCCRLVKNPEKYFEEYLKLFPNGGTYWEDAKFYQIYRYMYSNKEYALKLFKESRFMEQYPDSGYTKFLKSRLIDKE